MQHQVECILDEKKQAKMPVRSSQGAAGYDLSYASDASNASNASNGPIIVPAWGSALVPTGVQLALPPNTYGKISSRSGLSVNHNIEVGAGTIDADYRGEIKVILRNFSDVPFCVEPGTRIAQLIIVRIDTPTICAVKEFSEITERGTNGFGSTGLF